MPFWLIYFEVHSYRFDVVQHILAKLLAYCACCSYILSYEYKADEMPNQVLVERTPSPFGSTVNPPTTVYLSDVVLGI
jgi:hypothetical protein